MNMRRRDLILGKPMSFRFLTIKRENPDLSNKFNRFPINRRFRRRARNRLSNNNSKIWRTVICVRVVHRNFFPALKEKYQLPVGSFSLFFWLLFFRFFGSAC